MESSWAGLVVTAMLGDMRVMVVDIVMVWLVGRYLDTRQGELFGVRSDVFQSSGLSENVNVLGPQYSSFGTEDRVHI
jgi:hypothetical protein